MTERSGDLVGRFAALLASLAPSQSRQSRLCEAGQLMLDADGAAMTRTFGQGGREVWAATDDLATVIEDAQDVTGEGPAIEADRSGQTVEGAVGLGPPERWPFLEDRLQKAGFAGSVLAVPLRSGPVHVGILTAYRWLKRMRVEPSVADFLGRTLGAALIDEAPPSRGTGDVDGDWPERSAIHQATGMVVAQLQIAPVEALALLRARAYMQGSRLATVATSIVERRVRFDDFSIEGD